MRVIQDVRSIHSHASGDGQFALRLAERLLDPAGDTDVVLLTTPAGGSLFPRPERHVVTTARPYTVRDFFEVGREVNRLAPDIYHTFTFSSPFGIRAKVILTIYDLTQLTLPELFHWKIRLYCRVMVALSARRAWRVLTVSEHSRREIVEAYGIPPDAVHVIPCGINPVFACLDRAGCRKRVHDVHGIGGPFVLYAGRIRKHKNLPRLLEAYAGAAARGLDADLVVAGTGVLGTPWLEAAVDRLGLRKRVHLLEAPHEEDLLLLYNAAEMLIFPSLHEGFGLPPVEAMACGLPVIASRAGALPEVLGDAALLVDPLDSDAMAGALLLLARDAGLRSFLRERGLSRITRYSWDRSARELNALYRSAKEEHAARQGVVRHPAIPEK